MRIILILSLLLAGHVPAATTNPLEDPRLLKAAIDIQLTEEQVPVFQKSLGEFLSSVAKSTKKLMQRNNQTNLMKKIERKRYVAAQQMDKKMEKVLTDEQYPRYLKYRELLLLKISGQLDSADEEGTTSVTNMLGVGQSGT